MDPETMAVKEHRLPDEKTRSRRLAITSDDMICSSIHRSDG
jgi:hypothetical protein